MKSRTTTRFRQAYAALPEQVRRHAREAYRLFAQNPQHPSLRFRRVHPTLPVYSARVNIDYRAVGIRDGEEIVWFWIGSHGEYDQLLARL
ncbi:MAG: hypothetical protein M3R24_27400 [Chloroflexota bacterium]|nr:hypothetical protein [Chloroflexota bacterium]